MRVGDDGGCRPIVLPARPAPLRCLPASPVPTARHATALWADAGAVHFGDALAADIAEPCFHPARARLFGIAAMRGQLRVPVGPLDGDDACVSDQHLGSQRPRSNVIYE